MLDIIIDNELKGRIDITKDDRAALEQGYLIKTTMLNKCPKQGDQIAAVFGGTFTRCEIYHKSFLGSGPPGKAYRVIFGAVPWAINHKE